MTMGKPEEKKEAGKVLASYRCGSVQVTAWENRGIEGKVFNSFSFRRTYKDKSGEWKEAKSFNSADLLDLASLATEMNTMFRVRELEHKKKSDVDDMGECGE